MREGFDVLLDVEARIVPDPSRDVFDARLALVDETALYPSVADAAGVTGGACADWNTGLLVREPPASSRERDVVVLRVGEVRQLVEADELECLPLVVVFVR